jgi:hypothetical protein
MGDIMRQATGNECNMDLLAWYVRGRRTTPLRFGEGSMG